MTYRTNIKSIRCHFCFLGVFASWGALSANAGMMVPAFELRDPCLLGGCSMSHSLSPSYFTYFSGKCFYLGLTSDCSPPLYASLIAGITGMQPYLAYWLRASFTNFLPGLLSNHSSPKLHTSQVAWVTGVNYYAQFLQTNIEDCKKLLV
jgi:hypothetical protein